MKNIELSNRILYCLFQALRHIPVVKRLYPALLKAWARLTWTGGHRVKRYKGLYWLVGWRNMLDRKIALHGGYEMEQCGFFFTRMAAGCDVFLDVGANMGFYTLQASQISPRPEIHAFEPDPRNYTQLMANLYLNRLGGVVWAHNVAVSDKSGFLNFEIFPESKTGMTKVADAETPDTVSLPARPLDEALSFRGKKIFIKIDVEGHELAALAGAGRLLRDNECFLQIEIWPEHLAAVQQKMAALGYTQLPQRFQNDYYFCNNAAPPP